MFEATHAPTVTAGCGRWCCAVLNSLQFDLKIRGVGIGKRTRLLVVPLSERNSSELILNMTTVDRLKQILRLQVVGPQTKVPDDIPDDAPLVGGEFELDSLDALLLINAIEKEFAVKIPKKVVKEDAFKSLRTLAAFVDELRSAPAGPLGDSTPDAPSAAG